MSLNDAIENLRNQWTYAIDKKATSEQRKMRQMIGEESAKLLLDLRDDILEQTLDALLHWRDCKNIRIGDTGNGSTDNTRATKEDGSGDQKAS